MTDETIYPIGKPHEPPASVLRVQAIIALYNAGLLLDVDVYMDKPETDYIIVLAWENSASFTRNSPILNKVASDLGWSSGQLDQLFAAASEIKL